MYMHTHLKGEGCIVDMICGDVCRQLDDTYLCGDQISLTFPFFLISNFVIGKVREGLGKDRGGGQEAGGGESSAQAPFSSINLFGIISALFSSIPFVWENKLHFL